MNKLVILSLSFVLLMVLILPLSLTLLIKIIPGGIQPSLGNTEKIYGVISLSQAFISPKDNLTGIGVSIKNPNFANKKKTTVSIYDDGNRLIRTIILNGQNIADGKFVKILFDPIKDSRNKKFVWLVSSPESNFDDALQIFLTDNRPQWSLDLQVNNKTSEQVLSYVTLHRPSNSTEVLVEVMSGWVEKIKGDNIFFLMYFIVILSLASVLYFPNLYKIIRKNKL